MCLLLFPIGFFVALIHSEGFKLQWIFNGLHDEKGDVQLWFLNATSSWVPLTQSLILRIFSVLVLWMGVLKWSTLFGSIPLVTYRYLHDWIATEVTGQMHCRTLSLQLDTDRNRLFAGRSFEKTKSHKSNRQMSLACWGWNFSGSNSKSQNYTNGTTYQPVR